MSLSDDITTQLTSLDAATAQLSTVLSGVRAQAVSLQATIDQLNTQLAGALPPAQAQAVIAHLQSAVAALVALSGPATPPITP